MTRLAFALTLLVAVSACDSQEPDPPSGLAVYVGNQGNFSDNNGSVTRYDPDTDTATQDVVPTVDGLVQAVYGGGNVLYVLQNYDDSFTTGRGRIDLFDIVDRRTTDQYDVRTPRGLASGPLLTSAGPTTLYVSNLYDDTVTLLDLLDGTTGAPIEVGPNPEGVVSLRGRTYVANSGFGSGSTLTVLDTESGRVIDTLEDVCAGPRTLVADADLEVWVVCPGSTDFDTGEVTEPGQVVVLDGDTGRVRARYSDGGLLGSATFGTDAAGANRTTVREIYVIASGAVLRFDTDTNELAARLAVPGAPIGAVAYDVFSDRLYLGRPDATSPFGADGAVTIHDRAGLEVGRFPAGVAPSSITFGVEERIVEG